MHRRFRSSPPESVLALLNPYWPSWIRIGPPEMHRQGILMYPVYYVRKALKNLFEIKCLYLFGFVEYQGVHQAFPSHPIPLYVYNLIALTSTKPHRTTTEHILIWFDSPRKPGWIFFKLKGICQLYPYLKWQVYNYHLDDKSTKHSCVVIEIICWWWIQKAKRRQTHKHLFQCIINNLHGIPDASIECAQLWFLLCGTAPP